MWFLKHKKKASDLDSRGHPTPHFPPDYRVYVSFAHGGAFGSCILRLKKPITTEQHIAEVQSVIKTRFRLPEDPIILTWKDLANGS